MTSKTPTAKAVEQVAEATVATARKSMPSAPNLKNAAAMSAVAQIKRASTWVPHHAVTEISRVRVMHLHPQVAVYKTEMLEYFSTRLEA